MDRLAQPHEPIWKRYQREVSERGTMGGEEQTSSFKSGYVDSNRAAAELYFLSTTGRQPDTSKPLNLNARRIGGTFYDSLSGSSIPIFSIQEYMSAFSATEKKRAGKKNASKGKTTKAKIKKNAAKAASSNIRKFFTTKDKTK